MTDDLNPRRDVFLAERLNSVEVPPAAPDFWDTLSAVLAEPAAGSLDDDVIAAAIDDDLGRQRRRRRRRRAGLLSPGPPHGLMAVAAGLMAVAAALALLFGGVGYLMTERGEKTQVVDITDRGRDVTGVDGSAGDGTGAVPSYANPLSVDRLGPVKVLAVSPDGRNLMVSRDDPATDGQGCAGFGPTSTIEIMEPDGTIRPSGLAPGAHPELWPGADGRMVVTDSCEDTTTLRGLAILNPDGTLIELAVDETEGRPAISGPPVWSPDGDVFTITLSANGQRKTVFYMDDGGSAGSRQVDGELMGLIPDGGSIERVDANVMVGDKTVFAGADAMGSKASVDHRRGTIVVSGAGGIVVMDGAGTEIMARRGTSVIDSGIAPTGDVAWLNGPQPARLQVYDVSEDEVIDVDLGPAGPRLLNLVWVENGAGLTLYGSTDVGERVSWLVRFATTTGGVQPGHSVD